MKNSSLHVGDGAAEDAFVFLKREAVGHAGDVIFHYGLGGLVIKAPAEFLRQQFRVGGVSVEEFADDFESHLINFDETRMAIELVKEEFLQFPSGGLGLIGEADDILGAVDDIGEGFDVEFFETARGGRDDIRDAPIDQEADQMIVAFARRQVGIGALRLLVEFGDDGDLEKIRDGEVLGEVAVIDIVGVIGDLVSEVDELAFESRAQIRFEIAVDGHVVVGFVFDDAFARFIGEVEAAKIGVAVLDVIDDAQRLGIVIEAAVIF